MKDPDWDDLRLFLHVAEAGGLSGAARQTGVSAPTLGRRMLALERQTGQILFTRSQGGYALTAQGAVLKKRVAVMRHAAEPVRALLSHQAEPPAVRVSAGTATTMFLADMFAELSRPGDEFRLHFVTTEATLDIGHREIDLGIRNRAPDANNLAFRPLATLRFAPYRNRSIPQPDMLDWVAVDPTKARHPAARWLLDQGKPIRVYANSVATVHQLVKAGAGIGVMPCMIGDQDPALARAGPIIEALTETQYLVMHNDDRRRADIRQVIERIAAVYGAHADLLAGDRGGPHAMPDMS